MTLTHDATRDVYVVSAPDWYMSIERDNLESIKNCAYKLQEKGMLSGDAEVIQQIVSDLLIPALLGQEVS